MSARLVLCDSPAEFRARAGSFLLAGEAEHNLLYGILTAIEDGRYPEWSLWVLEDGHDVTAAAVRTPPHNLALSLASDEAVRAVADALSEQGERLPGVLGVGTQSRAFAQRWRERTGASVERTMAQRIYALSALKPVREVPGSPRAATRADLSTMIGWLGAFQREAHPEDPEASEEDLVRRAEWFLGGAARVMLLWEANGDVVSMAGSSGPTPNGIRVGPVYTPPEWRARGYASACVAELSRRRLAEGYRFCFLFTDLANPTSNAIYQRIGYEPVCDVDVFRFSEIA